MTRTSTIDGRPGRTIEPSRAWILGVTVGPDGGLEWHGSLDGDDAASGVDGSTGLACECPDDCPRDHPNE